MNKIPANKTVQHVPNFKYSATIPTATYFLSSKMKRYYFIHIKIMIIGIGSKFIEEWRLGFEV